MHSCCSIVFNMLSGFDLNSKGFKKSFGNEFGNLIWKKKRKFFPSPSLLHFGLLAHFLPRRPAGLPSLFLSSPPVFFLGRLNRASWQPLPPRPPSFSLPLMAWAHLSAPSLTSRASRTVKPQPPPRPSRVVGASSPAPRPL